ncbi:DUF305 domain-containing protein [Phyllobacterium sp. 21LDTY02-6]|jgi:uncharacterized protein (DUF305 family)|uniref:CopM family metallochaperone n=1 Tax=Phyllobacterium sp. 21LDTY02-6 TaxID=2944903 RepID=UPI002021E210|nr:DUF305 domain-containing protein [Phyllobacterium sp. 21LDTY02-6]MCO4319706.1 DUF305 domain-containing protein [Phyllobacterium sp. 21LDTY02-6]
MTKALLPSIAAIAMIATIATAAAQDHSGHKMAQPDAMASQKGDQGAASKAFAAANARMHKEMDIEYSGNADKDFVRGMIAHHRGAIDMAKVELEHGKDEHIRKVAETIIAAQEAEIKDMQAWLDKNGG